MKPSSSIGFYILGQAIGYAIDFGIFYLLISVLNVNTPVLDNVASKTSAAIFAFFFHARFSFPGKKNRTTSSSVMTYVLLLIGNTALVSLLLWLFVNAFNASAVPAKIVADAIGVVLTFVLMRNVVFPRVASS